ncbi:glycosyltransferase family 10 domain-containing protein [Flavobacterium caseinilyticum]|uniref:Fucosyltransferase C-terminal domain-containing protein n=1 Tax=Flavobacterium caseinilyticum TaxID=2541732 RepID=A0A4R5AW13_9FLAO|nr:glycosyltransferase family 10 [Flavobacterium caseinilyticum]TDD76993.1 hypothetical protein E0F89_05180 [Flavobacterium caseinilyticum]
MKNIIYINIITPFNDETFMRQLSASLEKEGFLFFENSLQDRVWDMVIVYEGLKTELKIKCKQGGILFISGEPPYSMTYSTYFLKQFDHLISSHPNLKHKNNHLIQQALPWHIGIGHKTKCVNYDYNDLIDMPLPKKNKKISIITSNKLIMPGHKQRMKFLNSIQTTFQNEIDVFGHGINPIDDKASALLDYQFNICVENSSINDYWTEKIADPFLGYCIPIYHGSKNISKYFDEDSLIKIDINNIEASLKTIENVLLKSDKLYLEKFEYLIASRNKILLEYNLFNALKSFYIDTINNHLLPSETFILRPVYDYKDQKIKMNFLRGKRFLKRYI